MGVEIQMKSSHLPWVKKEQTTKEIDIRKLFNIYWTSKEHEFTVSGQLDPQLDSLPYLIEGQRSLSLESIFALSNCNSQQMLLFVSLHCQSRLANNVHIDGVLTFVTQ